MTRWHPFALALSVALLDRLSKAWIEARVGLWEAVPVIPGFFQIVHTRNKGIAFGVFNDPDSSGESWALLVFALAVIAYLTRLLWRRHESLPHEHWTMIVAIALVLGGAAGNAYDRIRFGSVTDFLDFFWEPYHFPAFNVADSAITAGAALLIGNLWFARRAPR